MEGIQGVVTGSPWAGNLSHGRRTWLPNDTARHGSDASRAVPLTMEGAIRGLRTDGVWSPVLVQARID
jgi:hypothetical protein